MPNHQKGILLLSLYNRGTPFQPKSRPFVEANIKTISYIRRVSNNTFLTSIYQQRTENDSSEKVVEFKLLCCTSSVFILDTGGGCPILPMYVLLIYANKMTQIDHINEPSFKYFPLIDQGQLLCLSWQINFSL